jgi:hypothetical protein
MKACFAEKLAGRVIFLAPTRLAARCRRMLSAALPDATKFRLNPRALVAILSEFRLHPRALVAILSGFRLNPRALVTILSGFRLNPRALVAILSGFLLNPRDLIAIPTGFSTVQVEFSNDKSPINKII